ncbi:hypothetical protein KC678_01955 [Candidatus Dojkabacteria bacterium]|uniref:Uncharacterized protein n=1 Tax=Candidatus Dojkabacteria bacterium TaxID=2099670 RepID=A0A955L199_9BACT|nr:hypothetical protein [Candidatus Dojkabacteria bacterium]
MIDDFDSDSLPDNVDPDDLYHEEPNTYISANAIYDKVVQSPKIGPQRFEIADSTFLEIELGKIRNTDNMECVGMIRVDDYEFDIFSENAGLNFAAGIGDNLTKKGFILPTHIDYPEHILTVSYNNLNIEIHLGNKQIGDHEGLDDYRYIKVFVKELDSIPIKNTNNKALESLKQLIDVINMTAEPILSYLESID